VLLLLTKADKLSRAELSATLKTVSSASHREALLFSSVTRQGVEECRSLLEQWFAAGRGNKKPPAKGK